MWNNTVGGGADKSLARPEMKHATATKLGIYSTYSPRSSIHFLARFCNFASHSKKFRRMSFQPGLRGSNDRRLGRKITCFLSVSVTRKDLKFCTWTDPSFQRHYRLRPTKSGRSRAKDLSAPPRSGFLRVRASVSQVGQLCRCLQEWFMSKTLSNIWFIEGFISNALQPAWKWLPIPETCSHISVSNKTIIWLNASWQPCNWVFVNMFLGTTFDSDST
jgi:hypothetical protein